MNTAAPIPACCHRAARALHIHNEQAVETAAEIIARETGVRELVESLRDTLFASENADETGYVTDVGFIDLEAIRENAHALLARYQPPAQE